MTASALKKPEPQQVEKDHNYRTKIKFGAENVITIYGELKQQTQASHLVAFVKKNLLKKDISW